MATQQPHRVEAMVLASAASYFPEQARRYMRGYGLDSFSGEEWRRLRQTHRYGDEQIQELMRYGRAFADQYDDMNFTPPYLSTITARTLIIYGDRDMLYPVDIAFEMYTAIPHSYLWIVPNGDHLPVFNNPLVPFKTAALPFLRGDWERE
jgi:pimeloyl-ACP methyl ester carboxylesterase